MSGSAPARTAGILAFAEPAEEQDGERGRAAASAQRRPTRLVRLRRLVERDADQHERLRVYEPDGDERWSHDDDEQAERDQIQSATLTSRPARRRSRAERRPRRHGDQPRHEQDPRLCDQRLDDRERGTEEREHGRQ